MKEIPIRKVIEEAVANPTLHIKGLKHFATMNN